MSTNDPRLERYLTSLEHALKAFPVSDRAEIITEIKSHVLSALERDPQARLDTILAALGEPETVANRYLLERGLKPTKTSVSPIVKWLVIGFLGTFAMILIFTGAMITHFGSLVKIDGEKGRVKILGGLVDIDGDRGRFSIGDQGTGTVGFAAVEPGKQLIVKFSSGRLELGTANENKIAWGCKGEGPAVKSVDTVGDTVTLDLSNLEDMTCEIGLPAGAHVIVNGESGKIKIKKPRYDLDATLAHGRVSFQADNGIAYKFDMSVGAGKTDVFTSSDRADAKSIKVHVNNGAIVNKD